MDRKEFCALIICALVIGRALASIYNKKPLAGITADRGFSNKAFAYMKSV